MFIPPVYYLAAWHLPGGPVGPPVWWVATSKVEGGSGTDEGTRDTELGVRALFG